MSQNGKTPEIHIHPASHRNGFELRTFVADGKLGRLIAELDEDLQPHSVVEVLGPDGDEIAERIPVGINFNGNESMARSCVKTALLGPEADRP
ncbi:MAG TPA: hypothetical protein VFX79_01665 [Candidatus Saccharimonadales bacterium]|nr:hypothetical protein [Candidatus Saccharimonadales bacterium]